MRKLLLCCCLFTAACDRGERAAKDTELAALKAQLAERESRDRAVAESERLAREGRAANRRMQAAEPARRLAALRAELETKMDPGRAQELTAIAVSFVQGHIKELAMTPGLRLRYADIVDEATGQPRDPVKVMAAVKKWISKKFPNDDERDFSFSASYGPDVTALLHVDYDAVERRTRASNPDDPMAYDPR